MSKIVRRKNSSLAFDNDLPLILQKIYAGREVKNASEIDYRLANLLSFESLKDINLAVSRLFAALKNDECVVVVGDFDTDGATSTTLCLLVLRAMGFKNLHYFVPNRFDYGYGLSSEIVIELRALKPTLIITVDNGVASVDGVNTANEEGIDVIVTDHHLAPEVLPNAVAIVNPNQPGCHFPSKNLAGVGVIFYVLLAFRSHLRKLHWFEEQHRVEPNLADYLDLVALGTVADVVPLDVNNRILVSQGIERIRAGRCRIGICSLLQVAGKEYSSISSQDMGFILGPRINAAGRMDDISIGIECLLTEDESKAQALSVTLDGLNRDRRAVEHSMKHEAMAMMNQLSIGEESLPWSITLYDDHWHQGVIGILASRIKETYHRPVIAFAPTDDGALKGSGRSISGLHIRDTLESIATKRPDILTKFGGHAMAAGLTLEEKSYQEFSKLFEEEVCARLNDDDLQEIILTDGELLPDSICLESIQTIEEAGPWGQGFPAPVFDGVFYLKQQRIVGNNHLKMQLSFDEEGRSLYDAIQFNVDHSLWPDESIQKVEIVYQLSINRYRGVESVQMIVKWMQAL